MEKTREFGAILEGAMLEPHRRTDSELKGKRGLGDWRSIFSVRCRGVFVVRTGSVRTMNGSGAQVYRYRHKEKDRVAQKVNG